MTVYNDEVDEEHIVFISPEAYGAIKDWMDYRANYGEKITPDSPIIRDLWKTTNTPHGARRSVARYPKPLGPEGIKKTIHKGWMDQGIRDILPEHKRRHEFKAIHGFRKYFTTRAKHVMKNNNVERLLGHQVALHDSYYKPTEQQLLDDYVKAIPELSVNDIDKLTLQKKVSELTQKAQVAERSNEQIERMQKQIEFLMEHAYVSEHGVEWYETLTKHIPSKELGKYMDEADLLDSDPEHGKFVFEDSGAGGKGTQKISGRCQGPWKAKVRTRLPTVEGRTRKERAKARER